jgi:hypothetical protein
MSKLGIVICLLLGPPGWFYLVYKFMEKHLPGELPPEWSISKAVPKCIPKSYRKVKW